MNISSRCEYACRAVLELALRQQSGSLLTATDIAESRSIPEKYLVHIMLQLKRAGIVRSVRGAHGGYSLALDPEAITMLDIVSAVDGPVLNPLPVNGQGSEELAGAWGGIAQTITDALSKITIRSLLDKSASRQMYYI